jgi:hypothetical protein
MGEDMEDPKDEKGVLLAPSPSRGRGRRVAATSRASASCRKNWQSLPRTSRRPTRNSRDIGRPAAASRYTVCGWEERVESER